MKGIGGHQRAYCGRTNEWLTPPEIVAAPGPFDLDPCSPVSRPWPTARVHYTLEDDGLSMPWAGRVWLNPPYGPETARWLQRLAGHGDGVALVFARTETEAFHRWGWDAADVFPLPDPVPVRGRQGLWDLPPQVAAANQAE